MSDKETQIVTNNSPTDVLLMWTTHPIKKRPLVAVLVSLFILIVPLVVLSITSSKIFGFLSLVVLFASIAKFYFPTYFTLTESEAVIKSSTQTIKKQWSEFRSYYPDKNGVLLSPFVDKSRLENFRGIYLIFDNNADDVMKIVKQKIGMETDKEVTA
ncbi:MAG TPA: hypothetical protein ENH23_02395 [candidate division Zixibacteria bacterium]|nr:hypothetical protein [candidate division Zixibacteria bacterium]